MGNDSRICKNFVNEGGGSVSRGSGLTVKTLQAPFEGARFTPTIFSILAVGLLVVGLPLMAATATNIGSSISLETIDAVPGREAEGDIFVNPVLIPDTGLDLINSPYSTTSPGVPFSNYYTQSGISPLISMDIPNNVAIGTTHTVEPNFDPLLTTCIPKQVTVGPVYGGSSIASSFQEVAYNISKGDEPQNNDFRVAKSLQVEAMKDPSSIYPTCNSYDWDWNLQLPPHMFNTSSLITQIKFDIINDASVHGSTWGGSDYCITSSSSNFNVELMVNGTPFQSKSFQDYCGVVKVWNTSFNESNPSALLNSYRHTTGGEFNFELDPSTAFDLREFMDKNEINNYTISLKITDCGSDCPLGFVSSASSLTNQPIWINYYATTAEPDSYSTLIRGSALIIGLVFLISAIAATPLWNPLTSNIQGGKF